MKKLIFLLAVIMSLSTGAWAQKYSFKDLVGSWRTKEGAGLEVVDSFKLYLVYQDQKKMLVNYAADFSSNPATFNFVVKDASGYTTIKSNILFVNDELLQWQVLDADTKPANYLENQRRNVFILRRVEERTN